MNACPCHPQPSHPRDLQLDALATICAARQNDARSVELMFSSVIASGELPQFALCLAGIGASILNVASHDTGRAPDAIAGAVATLVRENT